jgi:hypothetical protein
MLPSLMLRMALNHAAQILREFWAPCSRALHLAHTPPPAQELLTWDAARIEPSDGFKLMAFIMADSDLRHSRLGGD